MYITSTIKTKSSRLAKPVLCLGTLCTAFLTGLNRVSEYRNHCSDVVAGFILGSAIALFLVRRFHSEPFHKINKMNENLLVMPKEGTHQVTHLILTQIMAHSSCHK